MISLAEYRVMSLSTSMLPLYSYSNQNDCAGYVNTTKLSFQSKWGICMYSLISNTKKEYYFLKHESCMWLMHLWPREEITRVLFKSSVLLTPWTERFHLRLINYMESLDQTQVLRRVCFCLLTWFFFLHLHQFGAHDLLHQFNLH